MKLLALRCPECSQPIKPENDHIVVACEHCATAVHIGDEGLTRLNVSWVAPRSATQVRRWLPFWVFHGNANIDHRDTQGGGNRLEEALRFWAEPRDLYVPAWELSLETADKVGSGLIQRQPRFSHTSRPPEARLTPATLAPADALKMLEFIVLAVEARRSDWLKSIDFHLDVGDPSLWALPADEKGLVASER
jgi:hypothetical protein